MDIKGKEGVDGIGEGAWKDYEVLYKVVSSLKSHASPFTLTVCKYELHRLCVLGILYNVYFLQYISYIDHPIVSPPGNLARSGSCSGTWGCQEGERGLSVVMVL